MSAIAGMQSYPIEKANESGRKQQGGTLDGKAAKVEARATRKARRERDAILSESGGALRITGYKDESARFFGGEPSKGELNTSGNDDGKGEDRGASGIKEEKETHLISGLKSTKVNNITGGQQQENTPVLVEEGKDKGGDVDYKDAKAEARAKRQTRRQSLSKSAEAPRMFGYEDESTRVFGRDASTSHLYDSEHDYEDIVTSAEKKDENPTTPKI